MKKLDEQAIEKIFLTRMRFETDYPQEGISEADEKWWREVIALGRDWSDAPTDRLIGLEVAAGHMFLKRMVDYCTPKPEGE